MKNDYKVSKQIISYIDILGYKNFISEFKNENEFLDLIRTTIDNVLCNYSEFFNKINYCIFSDNIIFALDSQYWDIYSDFSNKKYIEEFLSCICTVQHQFMKSSMLIRGSIVIGNLYFDSKYNYVFGSGLVKSYELESEAEYPRIIITDECVNQLKKLNVSMKYILIDCDNRYILNYLTPILKLANEKYDLLEEQMKISIIDTLLNNKTLILNQYYLFKENDKIKKKIKWLGQTHNAIMKIINFPTLYSHQFLISDDEWGKKVID